MKIMGMMLAAVAFTTVAALAQTTTTTPGAAVPPVTVTTYPISTTTTTAVCPDIDPAIPSPCAAKASTDITGKPAILVLGTEEQYALRSLNVRNVNWLETSMNMSSVMSPINPLLNSRPNWALTRAGNPFYPYYEIKTDIRQVAGFTETFTGMPANLNPESRATLTAVNERFRGLTTQQAVALGYQPVGACLPSVGQVYLNQSLIDNRFDAMVPEAVSFDRRGRLLAVHHLLLADQPFMAYGQMFQASPLVQGAQQLTVWQVSNRNGMFAMQNTTNYCQ